MQRIAVLGSTGSIGTSALDVVRGLGEPYEVVSLAAGKRWETVADQVAEFRPQKVALADEEASRQLAQGIRGSGVEVLSGEDGICALASDPDADVVIIGISGAAALPATIAAVRAGKRIGLANKEALVMAGSIVMPLAEQTGAEIIPVDSEHSALFQSLKAGNRAEVDKLLLTASGGPFRDTPLEELHKVTPEEALAHPTWNMGRKITVDSATMMNKALEIIEARWLFDVDPERIQVVVHPQSIVHSMVQFCDGSVIAQMGLPDMKVPIQLAITYPARKKSPVPAPDWTKIDKLDFREPDCEKFPSLEMGYRAAREGGTLGTVLNAANEVAVDRFFAHEVSFPGIFRLVSEVMDSHSTISNPSLEDIFEADLWARHEASQRHS